MLRGCGSLVSPLGTLSDSWIILIYTENLPALTSYSPATLYQPKPEDLSAAQRRRKP